MALLQYCSDGLIWKKTNPFKYPEFKVGIKVFKERMVSPLEAVGNMHPMTGKSCLSFLLI